MGTQSEQATLGGGCFWCLEAVYVDLKGVEEVVSGYAGGRGPTTYQEVCTGTTGHAEVVQVHFDTDVITFRELLEVFFAIHDPTTLNRQGPDTGRQYRSAIFYSTPEQKRVAEAYIKQLNDAKVFPNPIVTTLEPLTGFYPAEDYHQDFVQHNPNHPYILQQALPKVLKAKAAAAAATQPTTREK